MSAPRDNAPECVRCGTGLDPALDACLSCGQPGPWSADREGQWAVEMGPISSQRFRDHAVEQLRRMDTHLNQAEVANQLRSGFVRIADNLTRPGADALVEAFGSKETLAKVVSADAVSSRTSVARVFGSIAAAAVLAVVGILALAFGSLLFGFLLGGVAALGCLAIAALVLFVGLRGRTVASESAPLLTLGVAPVVPQGAEGLVERLHRAAESLGEDGAEVRQIGCAALGLLGRLADPDDFSARIAGGAEGSLGMIASDAARQVVTIAEGAQGGLNGQERTSLERVATALRKAEASLETPEEEEEDSIVELEAQVEALSAQTSIG